MSAAQQPATFLDQVTNVSDFIWGGTWNGEAVLAFPPMVIVLLGTGLWFMIGLKGMPILKLGAAFRGLFAGRKSSGAGEISPFAALSTALSGQVGTGNLAGVATALTLGGPGAIFWMWITALIGMALAFGEGSLAIRYREKTSDGVYRGGPMSYIMIGLGPKWTWLAVLFCLGTLFSALVTGNSIQGNAVADGLEEMFGIEDWIGGLIVAVAVFVVIIGGIKSIGKVAERVVPFMAALYLLMAAIAILLDIQDIPEAFRRIFDGAFNPQSAAGGFLGAAMIMAIRAGVARGLFSNEAGQGSTPIAHAVAQTDDPIVQGRMAMMGTFIDTIVICTMTALVIINTGVWNDTITTQISLTGGDLSYVTQNDRGGFSSVATPTETLEFEAGQPTVTEPGAPLIAWHEVALRELYLDRAQTEPFTGLIDPRRGIATTSTGEQYNALYGPAVESGAPLTALGFQHGLPGTWGHLIVLISVALFAVSTAIAWSYYGDRCAYYLFGKSAIMPYKFVYVIMHFIGAVIPLAAVWALGDIFLGVVILPNLLALLLLSPKVKELKKSYFQRKPWLDNLEAHRRAVEEVKAGKRKSAH
ncbi:MAG TPA: sodium:alanine symporter family protein [Gemmatimonadota bacterium]|nr:sodium:alanine symporter family protein [Gemmatimonadota bacterium]